MSTTTFQRIGENRSLCDIPPQQWRAGMLDVIDSIATTNAGEVSVNNFPYIRIRREDWDALMKARGTPEEVLARMNHRDRQNALPRPPRRNRP